MSIEKNLKNYLVKEASCRVENFPLKKIQIQDAILKKSFLEEAIEHLVKSGMAFGLNLGSLHTDTWNLQWEYPDITGKSLIIKKQIEDNFKPYTKSEMSGGHTGEKSRKTVPLQSGLYKPLQGYEVANVDSSSEALSQEPLATLVMRFKYKRTIKPRYCQSKPGEEEKNPGTIADNAIDEVNKVLNGVLDINEFIQVLESENIPLNSYYHPSQFRDYMGGGTDKKGINDFIQAQQSKYKQQGDIFGINPRQFYSDHVSNQNKNEVELTKQNVSGRTFSNKKIEDIKYDSYLLRAIANKVRQGKALDFGTLNKLIEEKKNIYTKTLQPTEKQTLGYDDHYSEMNKKITNAYSKGMTVNFLINPSPEQAIVINNNKANIEEGLEKLYGDISEKDKIEIIKNLSKLIAPDSYYHWGVQLDDDEQILGYRIGLETRSSGKHIKSTLTTEELKFLLLSLTTDAWEYHKQKFNFEESNKDWFDAMYSIWTIPDAKKYHVKNDEFHIPNFSLQFTANGLDSNPGRKGKTMLVLPTIRKLPDTVHGKIGDCVYDRDTGNMGRNHIVKNWYKSKDNGTHIEKCLGPIFLYWGPKCDAALQILSKLNPDTLFSGNSYSVNRNNASTADVAWKVVIPNRTNAETAYEEIISNKSYDNYAILDKEILSNPLSTALGIYYEYAKILEDKRKKVNKNDLFIKAVLAYQQDGNWNNFSNTVIQYLNQYDKTKKTDQWTKIDEEGFKLYKQYGYQIAKIMDFISCLMHASCGEKISKQNLKVKNNQNIEKYDEIFGRHYSTSSGKGSGGQIMIGIKYAFSAGELVADPDDTNLSKEQTLEALVVEKMINRERKRRHDAFAIKGPTYRRSSNHEGMQSKTAVIGGKEVEIAEHKHLPFGASEKEIQDYKFMRSQIKNNKRTGTTVKTIKVIEQLEYFIGEAGSSEGMLQSIYPTRGEHCTNWTEAHSQFINRFPTLENQLGVIISPINIRLDKLELSAKRAIDAVRKRLEAEFSDKLNKTMFEIILEQANGNVSVMSTDEIDDTATRLEKELEAARNEDPYQRETMKMPDELLQPKEQEGSDKIPIPTEVTQPDVDKPESIQPVNIPSAISPPATLPQVPQIPQVAPWNSPDVEVADSLFEDQQSKPGVLEDYDPNQQNTMFPSKRQTVKPKKPMESPLNSMEFITKKKPKRSLFRDKGINASLEDTLIKIADEFDNRGLPLLADKIDYLVKKLEGR